MGLIDKNGQPLQAPVEAPSSNGNSHGRETQDVRALPTGTLVYNLVRTTGEEVGLEGIIMQMEHAKNDRRMVADPEQLTRAREVHGQMVHNRTVIAMELNNRFRQIDEARAVEAGLEIYDPSAPRANPPVVADGERGPDA